MRSEKNIDLSILEPLKTPVVISFDLGVFLVINKPITRRRDTANKDNVQVLFAIFDRCRPCRTTFRMAGRDIRSHRRPPEPDRFAVGEGFVGLGRFKRVFIAEIGVAYAASFQKWCVQLARQKLRARQASELTDAARVIEMRVAIQDELYVRQFEAELFDIALDLRHHFLHAAVDQYISLWRDDQIRGQVVRADVLDVSGYPKWFDRPDSEFNIVVLLRVAYYSKTGAKQQH